MEQNISKFVFNGETLMDFSLAGVVGDQEVGLRDDVFYIDDTGMVHQGAEPYRSGSIRLTNSSPVTNKAGFYDGGFVYNSIQSKGYRCSFFDDEALRNHLSVKSGGYMPYKTEVVKLTSTVSSDMKTLSVRVPDEYYKSGDRIIIAPVVGRSADSYVYSSGVECTVALVMGFAGNPYWTVGYVEAGTTSYSWETESRAVTNQHVTDTDDPYWDLSVSTTGSLKFMTASSYNVYIIKPQPLVAIAPPPLKVQFNGPGFVRFSLDGEEVDFLTDDENIVTITADDLSEYTPGPGDAYSASFFDGTPDGWNQEIIYNNLTVVLDEDKAGINSVQCYFFNRANRFRQFPYDGQIIDAYGRNFNRPQA